MQPGGPCAINLPEFMTQRLQITNSLMKHFMKMVAEFCVLVIISGELYLAAAPIDPFTGETAALNQRWGETAFAGRQAAAVSDQLILLREDSPGDTKINRSTGGQPLRLGNKTYSRGIGSNSRCELRVRLSRPAERFVADIGLDRNVDGPPASVQFQVLTNGKAVFSSEVMRPQDGGRSIDVPLNGAREFDLIIDDGGDGRSHNQGDWGDARVVLRDGSILWLDDLANSGGVLPGLPFSFVYGGKSSAELLPKWSCETKDEQSDATHQVRTLTFTDPETHLVVKTVATIYRDTAGADWTLHFTNGGSNATPIIENVQVVDIRLAPPLGKNLTLHRLRGSAALAAAWQPFDQSITSGGRIEFGADRGKSSGTSSPFFTLDWDTGGVITAVGWSGQWLGAVERAANGSVRLQAGMQFLHLRLQPGESIRSPRILQVYWRGGDRDQAHNQFRRTMLAHIMPQRNGQPVFPPIAHLSTSFYEMNGTDEANSLSHLASLRGLGFETFWLDAYWIRDGFPAGVGNYGFPLNRVEAPDRFPNGLKPLSHAVHEAGLDFLLWFEPERISPETALAREHPDWVRTAPGVHGHHSNLLDIGLPVAREYMTRYLKTAIREYGVDVLRIDFNIEPLSFWQVCNSQQADRVGMAEIRYVEGLYQMWDDIRAEYPQLLIDNCASGGMRIDLETSARSIALWRTDDTIAPLFKHDFDQAALQNQVMTAGLNRYVPFSVSGQMGASPYHFRSGFNGGIAFCEDIRPADYPRDLLRQGIAEGKRLRKYYTGDFYPLSAVNTNSRDWCVLQYHRPSTEDGLIVGFRRQCSPFTTYQCVLRGIDPAATYEVTRSITYQPESPVRFKGADLQRMKLEIAEMPGSVVFEYKKITP